MNERGARIVTMDPQSKAMHVTTTEVPYPASNDEEAWARFQAETEPVAFDIMRQTLPPVVRRTPQQRYESMLNRVLPEMLHAYRVTGHMPVWPTSMQAVLDYIAERDHDPGLAKPGNVEHVITQGKALVRYLAETGARKQAEQDSRKVTLDWSGH